MEAPQTRPDDDEGPEVVRSTCDHGSRKGQTACLAPPHPPPRSDAGEAERAAQLDEEVRAGFLRVPDDERRHGVHRDSGSLRAPIDQ
jgi:hypothetical protein